MIGHVAARCSFDKARLKCTPTWWTDVSGEHYTVTKSSSVRGHDVEESLASDGTGDTTPDVLDQPVLAEVLASQTVGPVVPLVDPSLFVVLGLVVVFGPIVPTISYLGMPNLASLRESVLLDDSSSPVCVVDSLVSSGNWQNDAARLEDGWTTVKGKKSKSSIPLADINLQSYKGGSKSKPKS